MLQPMCKLDLTFTCCLARSRGTKQVQGLASQYLVRGDPQTEPFNEEPRWHVPDYCARKRCWLGDERSIGVGAPCRKYSESRFRLPKSALNACGLQHCCPGNLRGHANHSCF